MAVASARIRMAGVPGSTPGSRLRRYARLTWIELRFSYAWIFMPLAVAAAIWFFNAWLLQPGNRWDVVSSNAAQSFLLIGPAGAMWAAFAAAREGRSRLGDLTASMPVGSLPRHLLVIGTPVIGSVLAYGIGALAMMAWYGRDITWGSPDWDRVGFGAAVVFACAMVGATFGRLVQGRFAPVIVSGSLFLYFVISYSIADVGTSLRGWALLTYPRDRLLLPPPVLAYPDAIYADLPPLLAGYVICGVVVSGALAALLLSHRKMSLAVLAGLVAVAGCVAAAPMTKITAEDRAAANAAMSDGPLPVENPPLVCAEGTVTICLHQIDVRDLDQASAAADTLLGPLQGLPGVPHTVEMRADLASEPGVLRLTLAGQEIDAAELADTVIPQLFGEDGNMLPLSRAEQVIAAWLVRDIDLPEHTWFLMPPETPERVASEAEIDTWRADLHRDAERFAALSPEAQRAWLEVNWEALVAGELTPEDLP